MFWEPSDYPYLHLGNRSSHDFNHCHLSINMPFDIVIALFVSTHASIKLNNLLSYRATFIGLVAPLHASCILLAEICLIFVMLSSKHQSIKYPM